MNEDSGMDVDLDNANKTDDDDLKLKNLLNAIQHENDEHRLTKLIQEFLNLSNLEEKIGTLPIHRIIIDSMFNSWKLSISSLSSREFIVLFICKLIEHAGTSQINSLLDAQFPALLIDCITASLSHTVKSPPPRPPPLQQTLTILNCLVDTCERTGRLLRECRVLCVFHKFLAQQQQQQQWQAQSDSLFWHFALLLLKIYNSSSATSCVAETEFDVERINQIKTSLQHAIQHQGTFQFEMIEIGRLKSLASLTQRNQTICQMFVRLGLHEVLFHQVTADFTRIANQQSLLLALKVFFNLFIELQQKDLCDNHDHKNDATTRAFWTRLNFLDLFENFLSSKSEKESSLCRDEIIIIITKLISKMLKDDVDKLTLSRLLLRLTNFLDASFDFEVREQTVNMFRCVISKLKSRDLQKRQQDKERENNNNEDQDHDDDENVVFAFLTAPETYFYKGVASAFAPSSLSLHSVQQDANNNKFVKEDHNKKFVELTREMIREFCVIFTLPSVLPAACPPLSRSIKQLSTTFFKNCFDEQVLCRDEISCQLLFNSYINTFASYDERIAKIKQYINACSSHSPESDNQHEFAEKALIKLLSICECALENFLKSGILADIVQLINEQSQTELMESQTDGNSETRTEIEKTQIDHQNSKIQSEMEVTQSNENSQTQPVLAKPETECYSNIRVRVTLRCLALFYEISSQSGDPIQTLVNHGVIPVLLRLISVTQPAPVCRESLSILANIVEESVQYRNLLLCDYHVDDDAITTTNKNENATQFVEKILQLIDCESLPLATQKKVSWMCVVFFHRECEEIPVETVFRIVSSLENYLKSEDCEIVLDALTVMDCVAAADFDVSSAEPLKSIANWIIHNLSIPDEKEIYFKKLQILNSLTYCDDSMSDDILNTLLWNLTKAFWIEHRHLVNEQCLKHVIWIVSNLQKNLSNNIYTTELFNHVIHGLDSNYTLLRTEIEILLTRIFENYSGDEKLLSLLSNRKFYVNIKSRLEKRAKEEEEEQEEEEQEEEEQNEQKKSKKCIKEDDQFDKMLRAVFEYMLRLTDKRSVDFVIRKLYECDLIETFFNFAKDKNTSDPTYSFMKDLSDGMLFRDIIKNDEVDKFSELLDNGSSLTSKFTNGNSVIHEAVIKRSPKIIQYAIDKGVNINAMNLKLKTAFNLAVERGDQEISKILMRNSCNPLADGQMLIPKHVLLTGNLVLLHYCQLWGFSLDKINFEIENNMFRPRFHLKLLDDGFDMIENSEEEKIPMEKFVACNTTMVGFKVCRNCLMMLPTRPKMRAFCEFCDFY